MLSRRSRSWIAGGGGTEPSSQPREAHYLVAIAKLRDYLARVKDPSPGNMVLWRGVTRLTVSTSN
jgi:hypothetical protein